MFLVGAYGRMPLHPILVDISSMVRVRAPAFDHTVPWLNSDRPLSLNELRGQLVLLDFWTYGCINCLHVIPDLQYLEQKYANHLTIISIHTAKFDHEQNLESIQQAILRYGITHPVVVDRDRALWDQYAVRAYPTFVLIDPQGYVVATLAGEGRRQLLDDLMQRLLKEHADKGTLSEHVFTGHCAVSITASEAVSVSWQSPGR